jgi:hypothetical protein
MAQIEQKVVDSVNQPGRVGVLATADKQGRPNAAYFGSPRLNVDGTLVMGLAVNRSLKNLEENPYAVFFTIEHSPVDFGTKGYRLYLKAKEIQRSGTILDNVREAIAKFAGPDAAKMIQAGVLFEVNEIRPLIA